MPKANQCPDCGESIHPFAATCPNCGTDLDAHRRRLRAGTATKASRVPRAPAFSREMTDLVILTIVMLLLALYAPIYGAVLGLFIVWHSVHNGLTTRRNVAIACSALAIFNLVAPSVLLPITSPL